MSDIQTKIDSEIEEASNKIGRTWPLYSFVTANPLSGLEDEYFKDAIAWARGVLGGRGYPTAPQFREAWESELIDPDLLRTYLQERGINEDIEKLLDRLERHEKEEDHTRSLGSAERSLNQILEKWLSSFLDEGRARWSMPEREKGFYRAWTRVAQTDHHIPNSEKLDDLPDDKYAAIEEFLDDLSDEKRHRVFMYHMSALPGWVGYINQRRDRDDDEWSEQYPVDLADYMAVRLVLADLLDARIVPKSDYVEPVDSKLDKIRHCFLEAWEDTYREGLVTSLNLDTDETGKSGEDDRPDAQLVFCIDTRSEIIRRHIESTGNYETHGYAGFFGVPIRYRSFGESTSIDACPPIVDPEHEVHDDIREDREEEAKTFQFWQSLSKSANKTLKNIKDNVASAFNYVEFSGLFYGLTMFGKTLFPSTTEKTLDVSSSNLPKYHEVTQPQLNDSPKESSHSSLSGMELDDQVNYAQDAFELMGWETFAPIVVFVGHNSQTSNNPFDSSLRCGACSGNSGAPSARILAQICNQHEVRDELRNRGIEIPEGTLFLAGRHNTTTDEIELFDDDIPEEYSEKIDQLKSDLETAREGATAERIQEMPDVNAKDGISETEQRASDWAQTRPEWGLAGNASFIVGPNRLREEVDLEGRTFLHSYDWSTDPDGSALEAIFTGPVVVCQWINHQYYFSSIDNRLYGSGSKITHNPVGNFGVLQGNGGDLMSGLPLQSVLRSDSELQHRPLRILTVVHAPLSRVEEILEKHESIDQLVENDWIGLEVIDPTKGNERIRFYEELPGDIGGNQFESDANDKPSTTVV